MSRPGGDPTHWMPLWQDGAALADAEGHFECYTANAAAVGIIPADRVTIAPEPWTPKAGDRVRTNSGDEGTIVCADQIGGRLPVIWHDPSGDDYYGAVIVSTIEGPA